MAKRGELHLVRRPLVGIAAGIAHEEFVAGDADQLGKHRFDGLGFFHGLNLHQFHGLDQRRARSLPSGSGRSTEPAIGATGRVLLSYSDQSSEIVANLPLPVGGRNAGMK